MSSSEQLTQLHRAQGKLIPCSGGDPIPLLGSPLVIGRRNENDIVLQFGDVSGRHCTLQFEEGFWVAEDMQSRNGVRVNGERITRKVLFPDDRLSIASHRFNIHYVPQGSLAPPDGDTFSKGLLEKLGLKDISQLDQQKLDEQDEDDTKSQRYSL
jgi:pSer/pThr/pTyr-binding forkhead associated (FHA) protein